MLTLVMKTKSPKVSDVFTENVMFIRREVLIANVQVDGPDRCSGLETFAGMCREQRLHVWAASILRRLLTCLGLRDASSEPLPWTPSKRKQVPSRPLSSCPHSLRQKEGC